jgi:anthranilate synthase/aminodeoxychorismate synthase-like glutamine amidotransferase
MTAGSIDPKQAPLLDGGERFLPDAGSGVARVLVIDNYDSFTFNLVQYLLELGAIVDVYRNDVVTAEQVFDNAPTHLLMSPGPGTPSDSGVCQELARRVVAGSVLPTLGVCLGHQTLCEVHGATVQRAERIMHGKRSPVLHDGKGIFAGLPSPYDATRYHSLIVDEATLPGFLLPVAHTPEGELMAVRHASRPVFGVQFHPESILTQYGHDMLRNFLAAEAVTS